MSRASSLTRRTQRSFLLAVAVISFTALAPSSPTLALSANDDPDVCTRIGASYAHLSGIEPHEHRTIGRTSGGTEIHAEHWGLRSGPQILVIARVHGDECSPALLVNALRRSPPAGFGMWIIPELNPDGGAEHRRKNPDGIDINRDGYRLDAPETRALMEFTAQIRPILSIHVHSPNGWIGTHNGGIARLLGREISQRTELALNSAGRRDEPGLAFLWEGQARIIKDHPSVLIELPRIDSRETPHSPAATTVTMRLSRVIDLAREIAVAIRVVVASYLGTDASSTLLCRHCVVNVLR